MKKKRSTSIDQILQFIRSNADYPMKALELARAMGIKDSAYPTFRRKIKNLLDEGKLVKLKRNRIGLPEAMDLVSGALQITKSGFGFCTPDGSDEEIYIAAGDTLTAFGGDKVLIRLKPGFGFKGKRTGIVIKVVERKLQTIVGTFRKGRGYAHVIPDAKNINRDIYIILGKTMDATNGEKVVVRLVEWEHPSLNPEGEISERLGFPGDPGVDMQSIIREYEIPVEFSGDVIGEAEAAVSGWQSEILNRPDLTGLSAFTIDPSDAKDHDDAVSIEKEGDIYRLGVHIADVSHFVATNTKLDKEAYSRATSVYLPDRVIPMLPEILSNNVCSLRPNRKRLAFSIIIDFDKTGKALDYELFPSVIRSRARLSYSEVQDFYDTGKASPRIDRIADDLTTMRKLAKILLARRQKAGSLDFDLPEAKIILDKQGNVIEIGNRVRRESHRLVEEFMLAANRQVAYHFLHHALPTLYRVHDRPNMEKVEAFSFLISKLGYRFPVSPTMPTGDFGRLLKKIKGQPEEEFINELLLRSMAKAVYQPKNIGHFGLAFKQYLHFTSPIRRYPDLLVHRLLKMLKKNKYPVKTTQKLGTILNNAGTHCSAMERRAMEAERSAVKAKQVAYMAGQVGSEYDGIISGVMNFGFFVRLIGPECEGMIRLSTMDDDYYKFDEANYLLKGRRRGQVFRLGDKIRVGIMRVDKEAKEIDLFVVEKNSQSKKPHGRKRLRKRK
ncbi:MAG: ribonuclease R [candidate division Zixibacteria bacterium]